MDNHIQLIKSVKVLIVIDLLLSAVTLAFDMLGIFHIHIR